MESKCNRCGTAYSSQFIIIFSNRWLDVQLRLALGKELWLYLWVWELWLSVIKSTQYKDNPNKNVVIFLTALRGVDNGVPQSPQIFSFD